MNENQLKFLYDNYGRSQGFADYNEFKGLMENDANRKLFFDASNKDLGFTDYNEFETLLGVKKKEGTQPASGQPAPQPGQPSAPSFGQKVVTDAFVSGQPVMKGVQKKPVEKKPYQDITYKREELPSETTQMPETPVVKAAKKDFKQTQLKPQVQLKSTPEELEEIQKKTEKADQTGLILNDYQSTGDIYEDLKSLNDEDVNVVFTRIQRRPDLYAKYSGRTPDEVANVQAYDTRELYEADRDLVYKNYLADLESQSAKHNKAVAKANVVVGDILDKEITPDTYSKYTKEKKETTSFGEIKAGTVIDMDKVDETASAIAEKYNLPTDGDAWRLIKNELKTGVETEIIRPEAEAYYAKNYPELNKKRQEMFESGFKADEQIYAKVDSVLTSLENQYQQDAKNELNAIDAEYKTKADQLNAEYAQFSDDLKKQQDALTASYQAGQIDRLEYETNWNNLSEQDKVFYENYKKQFPDLTAYVTKANEINSKYNRKYQLQRDAIASKADAEMKEAYKRYALEYKEDPELLKQINDAYRDSFEKATEARTKKMGTAAQLSINPVSSLYQSTASALGGVFKGWGGSLDSKALEVLGESMEQTFMMPQARAKEFSDWVDPQNLTLLTGQLAGSMIPGMAAGAAVAIGTQGAGAPVAAQLIAGGLAGWATETVDIVGRSYLDRFEKTNGNIAEANLAAERSLQSQYDIMFTYAFDALPFVGKALKFIPSKAGRVVAGGATELVTETAQEYPQNIADENIQAGNEPWTNLNEALKDTKRMKETLISVGPAAFTGMAGQLGSTSKKSELTDAYIAAQQKSSLNTALPDQKRQYVQNMVFSKNAKFANGVVGTLFTTGQIDEQTSKDLMVEIERAERIKESGKAAGLSGSKLNVYGFYSARAEEAERNAAKFGQDPILHESYKQMAKQYRDAGLDFMKGGKPDLLTITYADGSQAMMMPEDANALFSDATALDLLSKKAVAVSAYKEGGEGVKIVDELKTRAEAYAKKNRYTQASTMASPLQTLRENIRQRTEQLDAEQADLTEKQRQAEIKKIEDEEIAAFESKVKEFEGKKRDERDLEIEQIQQQREALGVNDVNAFFSDMKPLVATTVERMETGQSAPQSAVKAASDYLYAKYKELTAMKSDSSRMMTIAQIESIQAQIEQDLQTLEGNPPSQKTEARDQENIQGIPSEVGIGQEPITTQPIQGTSQEAPTAGGVLQAQTQEQEELDQVRSRINQIEAARREGRILQDESPNELNNLKAREKQLLSKTQNEAITSSLSVGSKIQWNVFGNEQMNEWTVAEQTTTRGGQPAVRLTRFIDQGVAEGGGRGGYIMEHIVPISDLQQATPTSTEAKPTTKPSRKERLSKLFETSEGEEAVPLIEQALSESGIKVEVKDDADYNEDDRIKSGQGRGSEGMFMADDGTIILNRDKIKGEWGKTIVFHEGIHPVINIIRNTDPKRYRAIVDGLKAEAERNSAVAQAASDVAASEDYQQRGAETIEDETLVETMARVGTGDVDINTFEPTFREKFIEFMNDLAKMLGVKRIAVNSPRVEVKRLADQINKMLNEGGKLSDIVGKENVMRYENNLAQESGTIETGSVVYAGQASDKIKRGSKVKNPYRESVDLPVRTLQSLLDEYGDNVIVVNSDPTGLGTVRLPSGKVVELDGGIGYMAIQENIDAGVGFASSNDARVKFLYKTANQMNADGKLKNGKVLVLVMVQKADSMLGNNYTPDYVADALAKIPQDAISKEKLTNLLVEPLKKETFKSFFYTESKIPKMKPYKNNSKKTAEENKKLKEDYIKKYNAEVAKITESNAKKKAEGLAKVDAIEAEIRAIDPRTAHDDMVRIFHELSFVQAQKYFDNILGSYTNKTTKYGLEISRLLYEHAGADQRNLFQVLGEKSLVDQLIQDPKAWGYAVAAFVHDTAKQTGKLGGIKHNLFNAKFQGDERFILAEAHKVNDIMTEFNEQQVKKVEEGLKRGAVFAEQQASQGMYPSGKAVVPAIKGVKLESLKKTQGRYQASKGIKRGDNLVKETYYESGLTEDKNDYVFFHVSSAPEASIRKGIDSTKYTSLRTSRDEKGLQYGVASYYTRPEDGERMVGGEKYAVRVPKAKVYPIDSDPLGYGEKAEAKIPQGTPFRGEAVKREIADMAKKNGYEMIVGEWSYSRTGKPAGELPEFRADALVPLKPTKEKPESFTSNAEKGMERIPFPSQQSEEAKQELESIASEVRDIMSSKKKFSSKEYALADSVYMSGQVTENKYEDNEFKRDITPEEYDMMTKVLPKSMQAEAARVRGLLFGAKVQASRGIVRNIKRFSDNVSETVDRIKSATGEDGATLNLDGSTYEDGGLVVPAGSINVAQDDVSADGLFEFLKDNEGNISSDIFKIGLYRFPDRAEVSYDLNIVIPREYRNVALKFGELAGQESLFDLDTYENIKTGSDGKNPRKFTAQELAEIAKDLSEGRLPRIVSEEAVGYRGLPGEYVEDYNGIQYFAENEKYAGVFGKNIVKANISKNKILDLAKWNKKLKDAGIPDNGMGQPFLTVDQSMFDENRNFTTKGREGTFGKMKRAIGLDEFNKFKEEFDNADVIYGEDAGNAGEMVYAVRDPKAISVAKRGQPSIEETAKALENQKLNDDEIIRSYGSWKLGESEYVDSKGVHIDLPDSAATPNEGNYTLKIIPISSIDYFFQTDKKGNSLLSREYWEFDNEDNYQTENLDMIKEGFDTKNRKPIIVETSKDGLHSVVDGHHRLTIAKELGRSSILALVREYDGKEVYVKKGDNYEAISKAYHKAKEDGSNPELVKAVENLVGKPKRGQPSMLKRTSAEVQQLMEDSMDAVDQDVADGVDAKTAVEDNITSQEWYGQLTPKQKEQFDEIIKDEFGVTPKAPAKKVTGVGASIQNIVDNYYKLKDGDRSARAAINEILGADPKLKYIYDNISSINKQLQDAGVITDKTDGCP